MRHSQCVVSGQRSGKGCLFKCSNEYGIWSKDHSTFRQRRDAVPKIKMWFDRVQTSSNLAEKPSRLETSELNALGVERKTIDWCEVEAHFAAETGSDEWGFKKRDPRTFPRFAVKKRECACSIPF